MSIRYVLAFPFWVIGAMLAAAGLFLIAFAQLISGNEDAYS